jgi:hypothetical protein
MLGNPINKLQPPERGAKEKDKELSNFHTVWMQRAHHGHTPSPFDMFNIREKYKRERKRR